MNRRMFIIGGLVAVLLIAIPLTVYIANQQQPQDVRSHADEGTLVATGDTATPLATSTPTASPTPTSSPTPTLTPTPTPTTVVCQLACAAGLVCVNNQCVAPTPTVAGGGNLACATPDAVTNVTFDYPSCVGTQCNFTQASCTWAAVNGASSYNVKVTQVDSGTVTSTNTVTAPAVTFSFPVQQGQTYRCDITAVNSCGTSGTAGSAQALCAVDGQVGSPTVAVPTPTTFVGPTQAPQVIPPVAATGDTNMTLIVGIGGVVITIVGGLLFLFSGV